MWKECGNEISFTEIIERKRALRKELKSRGPEREIRKRKKKRST